MFLSILWSPLGCRSWCKLIIAFCHACSDLLQNITEQNVSLHEEKLRLLIIKRDDMSLLFVLHSEGLHGLPVRMIVSGRGGETCFVEVTITDCLTEDF